MIETLSAFLAYLSRVCGFETVDSFPRGHAYARTRWDRAYFDIASDLKPEQIERALCAAIANTPFVFAHITHPTPRMQRALLAAIETQVRRACATPRELVAMLIAAYSSPHTLEAVPGLRRTIEQAAHEDAGEQVRQVLAFLAQHPATIDAIDLLP